MDIENVIYIYILKFENRATCAIFKGFRHRAKLSRYIGKLSRYNAKLSRYNAKKTFFFTYQMSSMGFRSECEYTVKIFVLARKTVVNLLVFLKKIINFRLSISDVIR